MLYRWIRLGAEVIGGEGGNIKLNGYLLYGKRLKREICFRRNEILFYAEIQRKFTYLTSEASLISN